MEDEFIQNILEKYKGKNWNITSTLQEIDNNKLRAIKQYYEPFKSNMNYEINLLNTIQDLKGFMFIPDDKPLKIGCYIRYLQRNLFDDVELNFGGIVVGYNEDTGRTTLFFNDTHYILFRKMNDIKVFMKMNDDDKITALFNSVIY